MRTPETIFSKSPSRTQSGRASAFARATGAQPDCAAKEFGAFGNSVANRCVEIRVKLFRQAGVCRIASVQDGCGMSPFPG